MTNKINSLDDSVDNSQIISLVSSDGTKYKILKKLAIQSVLIKTTLETDCEDNEIVLRNVQDDSLQKIIEYMNHYADNPPAEIPRQLKPKDMKEYGIPEWDVEFMNISDESLFNLMQSANYLDIKPLLDLCCCKGKFYLTFFMWLFSHKISLINNLKCVFFSLYSYFFVEK